MQIKVQGLKAAAALLEPKTFKVQNAFRMIIYVIVIEKGNVFKSFFIFPALIF